MVNRNDPNTRHVLCVIPEDQKAAVVSSLDLRSRAGVEIVFEESADAALDRIGALQPAMVLVGMTLDTMDGLELVAMLFKRYPEFAGKVVVLPDEGDPFPPMAQQRDLTSGRSSTEQTDLETVSQWIVALGATSSGATKDEPAAQAATKPTPPAASPTPATAKAAASPPPATASPATTPAASPTPATASPATKPAASPTPATASSASKPIAPAATKPIAPAATKPIALAATKPIAPAATKPIAPAATKPTRPAAPATVTKPIAPAATKPAAPTGPTVTAATRPDGAEPSRPKPTAPDSAAHAGSSSPAHLSSKLEPTQDVEDTPGTGSAQPTGTARSAEELSHAQPPAPKADPLPPPTSPSATATPALASGPAPVATPPADGATSGADAPGLALAGEQPAAIPAPDTWSASVNADGGLQAQSPSAGPHRPLPSISDPRVLVLGGLALIALIIVVVLIALAFSSGESNPAAQPASLPSQTAKAAAPTPPPEAPGAPQSKPKPAPAAKESPDFTQLTTLPFRFDRASAKGTVAQPTELTSMVSQLEAALTKRPEARLEVGGHASQEGPEYLHQRLGEQRATNVARYLYQKGVAPERIVVKSYAATIPVSASDGSPDLKKSRRVTVRVVK